eukprot:1161976-Pelagomonas_calceolata.AAC.15
MQEDKLEPLRAEWQQQHQIHLMRRKRWRAKKQVRPALLNTCALIPLQLHLRCEGLKHALGYTNTYDAILLMPARGKHLCGVPCEEKNQKDLGFCSSTSVQCKIYEKKALHISCRARLARSIQCVKLIWGSLLGALWPGALWPQ